MWTFSQNNPDNVVDGFTLEEISSDGDMRYVGLVDFREDAELIVHAVNKWKEET